MASIEIRVKVIKGSDGSAATLAEVEGSIDSSTLPEFQQVMDKLLQRGVKNLVLDCSAVKYINSTGLGTLLKYSDSFESVGGHIAFCRVPSKVMLVMEMLGFNALFNIVADEAGALRSLAGQAGPSAPAGRSGAAPAALLDAGAAPDEMAAPVFPLRTGCARCRVALEIPAGGKYRCPRCGTLMAAEETGRMRFFVSKKPQPLQLSVPCQPQAALRVAELAGRCAEDAGCSPEAARAVVVAVGAACQNIIQRAYGADPLAAFHVLIFSDGAALTVKFADYGKPFDFGPGGTLHADSRFAPVLVGMDAVEYQRNPKGGNLLTLSKALVAQRALAGYA